MKTTLRYINDYDCFSTLDIMFMRHCRLEPVVSRYALLQYLNEVIEHPHGLRIIRSMPNAFLDLVDKDNCVHLTILYLTSPDSYGVAGLSTASLREACVTERFANGKFTKNPLVKRKHIHRPAMHVAARVKLAPGFPARLAVSDRGNIGTAFSQNPSVTLELVLNTPEISWDWGWLAGNPGIDPLRLTVDHDNLPWTFAMLSKNPRLTADLVNSFPDAEWDYRAMAMYMAPEEATGVTNVNLLTFEEFGKHQTVTAEFLVKYGERLGPGNFARLLNTVKLSDELAAKLAGNLRKIETENLGIWDYNWGSADTARRLRLPSVSAFRVRFTFENMEAVDPETKWTAMWCEFTELNYRYQDSLNVSHFLVDLGIPRDLVSYVTRYL